MHSLEHDFLMAKVLIKYLERKRLKINHLLSQELNETKYKKRRLHMNFRSMNIGNPCTNENKNTFFYE